MSQAVFRFRCVHCANLVIDPVTMLLSAISVAIQVNTSLSGCCDTCVEKLGLKRVSDQ